MKNSKQGGTLIYTTWKDGMNPIKYYSDLIGIEKYEFYIGVYGKK